MKKLLYQFDTDTLPSVFDNVVAYDGGADHISAYGGVNAKNVGGLVEGAIFTPGLKDKTNAAIEGRQVVLAAGAAGVTLLDEKQWQNSPALELIADANASPPAGIEGVGQNDRGLLKHGKILFGSLGFGALKLALHRACVARLFEQNDLILHAEEIYAIAKPLGGCI